MFRDHLSSKRGIWAFARAGLSWVAALISAGAVWELLRAFGILDQGLIPSASDIGLALCQLVRGSRYWSDVESTVFRAVAGLGLALIVGAPLGLLLSSVNFLKSAGLAAIDFLRSIPVTALYPIVVLTLGVGDRGKIGMIFFGCALIIALHAAAGFERRSRIRHEVARLFGASWFQLIYRITLPELVPGILTGVRVAAGLAMVVATLTEMFMGAEHGIGQSLMEAYSVYALPSMYAYVVTLGLIGFAINRVLFYFEQKTQRWHTR